MCENKIVKWWMVPIYVFLKHLGKIVGMLYAVTLGIVIYNGNKPISGMTVEITGFWSWFEVFSPMVAIVTLFLAMLGTVIWLETRPCFEGGSW